MRDKVYTNSNEAIGTEAYDWRNYDFNTEIPTFVNPQSLDEFLMIIDCFENSNLKKHTPDKDMSKKLWDFYKGKNKSLCVSIGPVLEINPQGLVICSDKSCKEDGYKVITPTEFQELARDSIKSKREIVEEKLFKN